jgi:hypothetical protein
VRRSEAVWTPEERLHTLACVGRGFGGGRCGGGHCVGIGGGDGQVSRGRVLIVAATIMAGSAQADEMAGNNSIHRTDSIS